MAQFAIRPMLTINVTLSLTEEEARAVEALGGYGEDSFVKAFYELLGEHYMKPHEEGLRSFLRSSRHLLGPLLSKVDKAKEAFAEPSPCPK